MDEDNRPLMVGERTNVLGSRRFKRLIREGEYEQASEVGRAQVKKGAHIVDVCLQDPDRDEAADMDAFLDHLVRKIKVPPTGLPGFMTKFLAPQRRSANGTGRKRPGSVPAIVRNLFSAKPSNQYLISTGIIFRSISPIFQAPISGFWNAVW